MKLSVASEILIFQFFGAIVATSGGSIFLWGMKTSNPATIRVSGMGNKIGEIIMDRDTGGATLTYTFYPHILAVEGRVSHISLWSQE